MTETILPLPDEVSDGLHKGRRIRGPGDVAALARFLSKAPLADLAGLGRQDKLGDLYPEYAAPEDGRLGYSAENWCMMPRLGNHLYLAIDAGPIHDEAGHLIRRGSQQAEAGSQYETVAPAGRYGGAMRRRRLFRPRNPTLTAEFPSVAYAVSVEAQ